MEPSSQKAVSQATLGPKILGQIKVVIRFHEFLNHGDRQRQPASGQKPYRVRQDCRLVRFIHLIDPVCAARLSRGVMQE
jgi:hypothetical protein